MTLADELRAIADDLDAAEERANARLAELVGGRQVSTPAEPASATAAEPSPADTTYPCLVCGAEFSSPQGAALHRTRTHRTPPLKPVGIREVRYGE